MDLQVLVSYTASHSLQYGFQITHIPNYTIVVKINLLLKLLTPKIHSIIGIPGDRLRVSSHESV